MPMDIPGEYCVPNEDIYHPLAPTNNTTSIFTFIDKRYLLVLSILHLLFYIQPSDSPDLPSKVTINGAGH